MKRRDVMVGGAALAAGLAGSRAAADTKSENADRSGAGATEPWVALLSDPHIDADPRRVVRGVRMAEAFERVVERVVGGEAGGRPEAVFINGDVSRDDGRNGDYAVLNRLMSGFGSTKSSVYLTAGNHDHRGNLRDAGLFPGEPVVENKLCQKVRAGGADWYLLDSLRYVDEVAGSLGEEQLAWLAEQVDAGPADRPAFVLTHHQPEDPKDPDDDGFGLADGSALIDLLWERTRVKAVFHGHRHAWSVRPINGMHLVGLPTTSYVFRAGEPSGYVEARVWADHLDLTRRSLDLADASEGEVYRLAFR